MKIKALALVASLLAAPVIAQPIYIDIGANYGGNANKAAGSTTTGLLEELQFNYNSWSTIQDNNGDGIGVGDIITSTGGLKGSGFNNFAGLFGNNSISSFLPQQFGAFGPSNNGYKNGWELSFGFDNLVGVLDAFGGVQWQSGTISFYATTDVSQCAISNNTNCFTQLFDMEVTSGGNIPSATILSGYLTNFNEIDSINGVLAGDIFNIKPGPTGQSFLDMHKELALKGQQQAFNFKVDQNVAALPAPVSYDPVTKTYTLAPALHDGSISFSVSEPTSVAVLGLGLLGLGFSRRNKKAS
ncbi:MAG: PEP-CTERM sorting domain-containing protein [Gammaproteobacteria bacterium]|nr:PEP-CTERM sorting domain-containing protein [Gammaproteobacteria bacterium]MBU2223401.1 PEP-CTERM sorting domain-containing protein [Gammaproteobacteria bacterium]MBU2426666.1 PEP-CTERM sorting domain-containing protein [Gammaproteobacteria bacterium]